MSCMRLCKVCCELIATSRLAALPATTTCVDCSTEQPVTGYMTWEHKTAPIFQVVTPAQHQWLQSRDRKGMRPGFTVSSRGSSADFLPVAYTSSAAETAGMYTLSLVPTATRCKHKDSLQASSAGKCLECSVDYYRRRVAVNHKSAEKNMFQSR